MLTSRCARQFLGVVIGLLLSTASAPAQTTERVSVDSAGNEAKWGGDGGPPVVSSDGRFVAFESVSDDLVANDHNGAYDFFVHDRWTGTTERMNVDSSGAEVSEGVYPVGFSISADGRFVAFTSISSDLVPNDTNSDMDHFVHDRLTGVTERVSVDSSGNESHCTEWGHDLVSLSSDGRYVAFSSDASDLVPNDTNGQDVFVHDRATGITERVSVDSSGSEGNDDSYWPEISADGNVVVFISFASNLVPGDTNGTGDIFVHDRTTGITERVSIDSNGVEANNWCGAATLSEDGRIVAFMSTASNLVSGDTNGTSDIFVRDRSTGITDRVSVDSSGVEANSDSDSPSISNDGQRVAFISYASNLVAGDTNGAWDNFVHVRSTGVTFRVSVDSSGVEGNSSSGDLASISSDGNFVVFGSSASNLVAGDANGREDIFIHEIPSATWTNYGVGFPGTHGIPAFTARTNPAIGSTLTLDLANSYANPTSGLLFLGFQQTNLPTSWGGDLLVVPALVIPVSFAYGGNSYSSDVPEDPALIGAVVDLQAFEADPGAAKGVSFTQGLELTLGY